MSIIALPLSVRIKHIEWELDRPAQVNRSAYDGTRTVVANPWHGKWAARVTLATEQDQANVRAWRAFFARLKGQIKTFQLPATEGAQYVGTTDGVIANRANTTVTALGAGVYTIEKTAGGDAFNASALSSVGMTGDFTLRIKQLTATTNLSVIGVNSDATTDDNFTGIDFGWAWNVSNLWDIYESGGFVTGGFADATYAWIWRRGATLYYGRGASLVVAQASPDRIVASSAPVRFDSSLWHVGDKFEVLLTYEPVLAALSSAAQGATALTLDTSANTPELITNGTFASTTTGWTATRATLSVVSGRLRVTNTAGLGLASQSFATVAGHTYTLVSSSYDGTAPTRVDVGTGAGGSDLYDDGGGSAVGRSITFVATTTTTWISLYVNSATVGLYAEFDDLSVKKLVPAAPALVAGMMATVTLPSGNKQLVLLTADISASALAFEPPLREAISAGAVVEAANPFALVALTDSAVRWSVDPYRLYNFSFDVEEAF